MYEFNKNQMNIPQMSMEPEEEGGSFFDPKKIWMMFVLYWKWFIPSVAICLIIAMCFLWTEPTTLSVTGKMRLINQEEKGNSGVSAGIAVLNSLPLGIGNSLSSRLGGAMGIEVEKEVLKSNDLIRDVVLDLELYTEYRMGKWGRTSLLYKNQPINVSLDKTHLNWMDRELPLNYHSIYVNITKNEYDYEAVATADGKTVKKSFKKLPASMRTEAGTVLFKENTSLTAEQRRAYANGFELQASILPPKIVAGSFIGRMVAEPPTKNNNTMLYITLRDESMVRGMDFITRLVDLYNKQGKEDVDDQNRKTDEFVNQRLAKLDEELGFSDDAYEDFKVKNKIVAPEAEAGEAQGKKTEYEQQLIQIGIQLQLHDYMTEFAADPANRYEVIPIVGGGSYGGGSMGYSGGVSSGGGGQAMSRHNTLAFQFKELLKGMSDKSPQVQRVKELIDELHPTMMTELSRQRQAIVIQRQNAEREYSKAMERIGSAPALERAFTDIERVREIKQGVYVAMLQKREDLALSRIDATNKGKLIEKVQVNGGSVLPNRNIILLIALVIGIAVPLLLLLLYQFLKPQVESRSDLDNASKHPLLGEIPTANNDEAYRTLRTNLLLQLKEEQKVLLVTSDAIGDGKTYNAIKVAEGLARLNKKVILCDLNLRRPSVGKALSISGQAGLYSLLASNKVLASDIQQQIVNNNGYDVLVAGTQSNIHPSDLLSRENLSQILTILKDNYDYVILDTPALEGNSDTYQIATLADATCFIVKADHTSKSTVKNLDKSNRLPHKMMIFNAIDMTKKKYKFLYKHAFAMLAVLLMFSSCSIKKYAYFQGIDKIDLSKTNALYDARIMPKDQLTIRVYTINAGASTPFNMGSVSASSSSTGGTSMGSSGGGSTDNYLVSNDGTINFPVLGRIKVVGLTKDECEDMILEKIRPYMAASEKPIVTVRQENYTVTILGDVGGPGVQQITREKVNIYEALAMAGDITPTGKRDCVKLFRENADGTRELHILDLSDANIINSPYFYLQQNDMIYVESNIVKKQQGNLFTSLIVPWTTTLVSFSTFLITVFKL